MSQAIELVPTNDFLRLFITVIRSWEERGLRPFKRDILFSITTANKVSIKSLTSMMVDACSHCLGVSKARNELNSKGLSLPTSGLESEKLWHSRLVAGC